jgi:hypothetical protein
MSLWVKFEKKTGSIDLPEPPKKWVRDEGFVSMEWTDEMMRTFCKSITGGKFGEVVELDVIPYPALPILFQMPHLTEDGRNSPCPPFCYTPEECKGQTCCGKNPCCTN